jgi:leucyl aminopeptidase (aminopeptidase T)
VTDDISVITYRRVVTGATAARPTVLEEVARRVVVEYLGVEAGEAFLVVTDTGASPEIADAVLAVAFEREIDASHLRLATRARSGEEPPPAAAAAMAAADVCLCVTARSLYHTRAKGEAQAAGTRGCFNAPAHVSAWIAGAMTADFTAIRATAERLAARLRGADRVRVTSPAGTDVTVRVGGREPRGWYSGIVRNRGEISAFPGGEVSFPPLEGTAQGRIVFERVLTDLGRLAEPIAVAVENGEAVSFEGGRDAARLRSLVDDVPGATNVAELGIGLNDAARISDDITESKKKLGTAHFALGDNAGGYGGVVECPLHLDGMLFDVSVAVDGDEVVRDGRLVL